MIPSIEQPNYNSSPYVGCLAYMLFTIAIHLVSIKSIPQVLPNPKLLAYKRIDVLDFYNLIVKRHGLSIENLLIKLSNFKTTYKVGSLVKFEFDIYVEDLMAWTSTHSQRDGTSIPLLLTWC